MDFIHPPPRAATPTFLGLALESLDFELADVFDAIAIRLGTAARAKGFNIWFKADPGLAGRFRGDLPRIRQVLAGYVAEVIDSATGGTISIRACCSRVETPHLILCFEVVDDVSFTSRPASRRRAAALAECGHTAAALGGKAASASREGAGAAFRFTVPLACVPLLPPRFEADVVKRSK